MLRKDDSIDEIASALLDDASEELMRQSTLNYASLPEGSHKSLGKTEPKVFNNPPPLIPQDVPQRGTKTSRGNVIAPTQNGSNARVNRRDGNAFKRSISHPIQQKLEPGNNERPPRTPTSGDPISPFFTPTEAMNLNQKIANLTALVDGEATKPKANGMPGRLQRGRDAIVKAGRAIVDHLSSSSSSNSSSAERGARRGPKDGNLLDVSREGSLDHEPATDDATSRKRTNRRIAEGTNLSKPKIRLITGDGHIPRKPLPTRKDMKMSEQTSTVVEDPFSDDIWLKSPSGEHGSPDLNVESRNRLSRAVSVPSGDALEDSEERSIGMSPINSNTLSRFSDRISGLVQHPDVEVFSSSPVGYSTPRVRLVPTYSADGTRRLTIVKSSVPSLLDFSFEDSDGLGSPDELALSQSTEAYKNLSLKRKTAKEDLRTVVPRPTKKPKRTPMPGGEEVSLASRIEKLDTQDIGPLGTKDQNKKINGMGRGGSKGKGLTIFDHGKSKEAKPAQTEAAKKLRRKHSKRSSIPRPVGRPSDRDRKASSAIMIRSRGADITDDDEL